MKESMSAEEKESEMVYQDLFLCACSSPGLWYMTGSEHISLPLL